MHTHTQTHKHGWQGKLTPSYPHNLIKWRPAQRQARAFPQNEDVNYKTWIEGILAIVMHKDLTMNLILGLEACKYTHTHHTHAHTPHVHTHTTPHTNARAHTHTISDGHCNITSLILDTQHRMIILVTIINRLSYTFLIFELTSCHSIFVFAIFGTVDCRSFILLLRCWPPHFSFLSRISIKFTLVICY